jgi:hypothetical protein
MAQTAEVVGMALAVGALGGLIISWILRRFG